MSRGGVKGFKRERLNQVLSARGMNQVQLARLLDISTSTISKWCSGKQLPEAQALDKLSEVMHVRPEWFTRALPEQMTVPLFRSNVSALKTARSELQARLEWAQEIALKMSEFLEYPALKLPECRFKNLSEISQDEIETAADECRKLWNLGKGVVPDVALAVENAGIILIREQTGHEKIEGLSAWSHSLGRPFIYVSSDKENAYRSRFDIAHELGHLILHKNIDPIEAKRSHKEIERQAHAFAGAFLLPAQSFAIDVAVPISLNNLLMLKKRWGVSVAAMIMRLKALNIIDEYRASTLFRMRSARWGTKQEPGDNERIPEKPRLLRRSIQMLIDSSIMLKESIPDYLGLSKSDIEGLAGLADGYLSSNENNIIRFPSVRRLA